MRFQVPQFIEVEDKIFGPLTFKQFLYLGGGAGATYIVWFFLNKIMPGFIALIIAVPIMGFFAALALYRINPRQPFAETVQNAFQYFLHPKLYVWSKEEEKKRRKEKKLEELKKQSEKIDKDVQSFSVPRLSESKLKELSWGLDISENVKKDRLE